MKPLFREKLQTGGRQFFLALLPFMLVGCASPRLAALKSGEEVAIVMARERENAPIFETSGINSVGKDAAIGMAGGAGGGAVLGLSCGPWASVCIPLGAVAGAISGLVAGAATGALMNLPDEQRVKLNGSVQNFALAHDPRQEMLQAIREKAAASWKLSSDQSGKVVSVRLNDVGLRITKQNTVALAMNATVSVTSPGLETRSIKPESVFSYVSADYSIRLWLEDNDDFVANSFRHAYRHLAENICSDLLQ